MGVSVEDKKKYLEDSESREAPYIRQIDALYNKVLNQVTNDAFAFFNSRQYINAKSNRERARKAKADKGMKRVAKRIKKLGDDTIELINKAQPKHYNEEGIILTNLWNENTPSFFTMTFTNANKAKAALLISEPYRGEWYSEWQKSATKTAMNSWNRTFRGIMSSNVVQVGKVSKSMQLTSDLRNTIDTMMKKAKSLMDAALSETVRILITDTQETVLKAEKSIAKKLQKRAEKWA